MEIIDPQPTGSSVMNETTPRYANGTPQPGENKPDNFLPWAILSTILCCLPFGVVAIVYATQVDTYWFSGDREAARRAAQRARMWTWVSVGVAAVGVILYLSLFFVLGMLFWSSVDLMSI